MSGKEKALIAGAGIATLIGFNASLPFFIPLSIAVLAIQGMAAFANKNHEEWLESRQRSIVIDADEIIPPQKVRKQSYSDDVIDMSMDEERQIWRAEAEIAKLEAKLAKKRSALRTLKRSAQ
jgi:hypothetical protein